MWCHRQSCPISIKWRITRARCVVPNTDNTQVVDAHVAETNEPQFDSHKFNVNPFIFLWVHASSFIVMSSLHAHLKRRRLVYRNARGENYECLKNEKEKLAEEGGRDEKRKKYEHVLPRNECNLHDGIVHVPQNSQTTKHVNFVSSFMQDMYAAMRVAHFNRIACKNSSAPLSATSFIFFTFASIASYITWLCS